MPACWRHRQRPSSASNPEGTAKPPFPVGYLNFSAKFAYHFATIDALYGDASSQHYISLQFSGGAGSYCGRAFRRSGQFRNGKRYPMALVERRIDTGIWHHLRVDSTMWFDELIIKKDGTKKDGTKKKGKL